MPQARTGYELKFEEILAGNPELGAAAILPWDTETFGFPVASYRSGADELDAMGSSTLSQAFPTWMRRNGVSVCACVIPPANSFWKSFLPELGFSFVDFGVQARLSALQTVRLPQNRCDVRPAEMEDSAALEAIAMESFEHGRYFADGRFPRELAQRRYRNWIRNALAGVNSSERVYVLGPRGRREGFFHVALEGKFADLRLAAIAPELRRSGIGFDFYAAMLHELKRLGVSRAVSSVSAANVAVMNIYSALGFRFAAPEAIYHWHDTARS